MRRKREEGKAGAQGSALTFQHPLTSELQVVQGRVCLQREEIQGAIQPGSHDPEGEMWGVRRGPSQNPDSPRGRAQTTHSWEEAAQNWAGRLDTAPNGLDNGSTSGTAVIQRSPSPENL